MMKNSVSDIQTFQYCDKLKWLKLCLCPYFSLIVIICLICPWNRILFSTRQGRDPRKEVDRASVLTLDPISETPMAGARYVHWQHRSFTDETAQNPGSGVVTFGGIQTQQLLHEIASCCKCQPPERLPWPTTQQWPLAGTTKQRWLGKDFEKQIKPLELYDNQIHVPTNGHEHLFNPGLQSSVSARMPCGTTPRRGW